METNSVFRMFTKYVSLNVLGMLGLSCYILADTFFVARGVGSNGLAALNLAIPIYSFINGLGLMIGMGGSTRYSIENGISEKKRINRIFSESALFALLCSCVFFVLGLFFAPNLAILLGANGAVLQMTTTYLRIILLFAPMFLLNNTFICFVRNDGNPRLSMIAMLTGSFANIILDYVFVFPLQLGIFGAALATGIAPVLSLLVLHQHLIKKSCGFAFAKTQLTLAHIKDISSLGACALITEVSAGVVMIVFNTIILSLAGNVGVAAYGVVANLSLVATAIFTGIAQGIQPIISRSFGNNNMQAIQKIHKYAIVTALLLAVGIYSCTFFFAGSIVALFNKEQNPILAQIGINGLQIYFSAFVFVGVNIITAVYFSSVALAKQAFFISFLRGFVVILPAALWLSATFGMVGVWLAFPVTEGIVCLVSITFKKKSKKYLL